MDRARRDFLDKLAMAGFAIGIGGAPLFDVARARAATTPKPLAVAQDGDPAEMVRAVIGKLGGMGKFVNPGATVVVKPNIGWDRTPEEAANTNPEVVAELVKMALEAGAAKVSVFDRTCNDARRCYKRSGIADAVEKIGDDRASVPYVDDLRYETVEIKGGEALDRWPLYRPALEADVLINVPIVKHHGLSGITVGMKNLMGIMGGNRGRIHRKLGDSLVDLNFTVRSTLTVVDATRVLTSNGPQGGGTKYVREEGKLAACEDIVTADAWGATVFGVEPMEIGHIRAAAERGLGIADLSKVKML